MAINCYLAMTAAEIRNNPTLPPHFGWMACHFSPYGTGLSNLPRELPEGAMLILNDRIPICGHDPDTILSQLSETAARLKCGGILLDFQRPDNQETAVLAKRLLAELPCPAAVTSLYTEGDSPVFLPPVPVDVQLAEYLAPWQGREIWLEASLEGKVITLTPDGAVSEGCACDPMTGSHADEKLHCHYHIVLDKTARFTLWRTGDDLTALLTEAQAQGVTRAVGLFQELGKTFPSGK